MKINFKPFALLFACSFFIACSFGDDYLVTEESEQIVIEAYIGSIGSFTIDTVISIHDSVYLNGSATTEKKLRLKDFFWNNDNGRIFSEYRFKAGYKTPGQYYPTFFIVDYFGDTLTKSVSVKVTEPPSIDSLRFTPYQNAETIPADTVNFAWIGESSNNDVISYTFSLACADTFSVDSVLNVPYISVTNLPVLETCVWSVQCANSYNIKGNSLEASFTTKGPLGMGRIVGRIEAPKAILQSITLSLIQEDSTKELSLNDATFDTYAIPAGNYTLQANSKTFPDFKTVKTSFVLKEGFKKYVTLRLTDTIAPTFAETLPDTLPYETELYLPMQNGGIPLSEGFTSVILDGTTIESKFLSDTLYINLPEYPNPVCRIMEIEVSDASSNKVYKKLYLCKQSAWATIPGDTTVQTGTTINLPYKESNPYGLTVKYIQWYVDSINTHSDFLELNSEGYANITLSIGNVTLGSHRVYVKTFYENCLEITAYFNIEVIK